MVRLTFLNDHLAIHVKNEVEAKKKGGELIK